MSRSTWLRVLEGVGSLKLSTALFLLLGVLTFAGTLEQQYSSLYDVQARFFESFIVVWWAGGVVPVPLLGGYLLLGVLFVNLLVGGIFRIRKGLGTVGVIIAHLGILSLLAGCFVEDHFSTKGQMTLTETQAGNEYRSVHEWEVVVTAPHTEGVREFIIPWESFKDLDAGESVTWAHPDLPFSVVLTDMARNGEPRPAQPGDTAAVEGFILQRLPEVGMGNRVNIPALTATLHPPSGERALRSILWGMQDYPWDPTVGGVRFLVELHQRTWTMPFAVRLERFEHEMHPGIGMAKRYSSFVTRIDGATQERVHITMNEPLRWRGYTLYQSDFGPKPEDRAPPGTPMYSTFSVVRNPSDQWPKWMTWIIAFGMGLHFIIKLARYLSRFVRRNAAAAALLLLAVVVAPGCGGEAEGAGGWTRAAKDSVARVAVQSEGRVKPLSTWAAFALLGANHRRSCTDGAGDKLTPTEWWLDAAFRGKQARTHICFVVSTNEILDAIEHTEAVKKKRDRYSYDELADPAARGRLDSLARQYRALDPKDRSRVQAGIVDLDDSMAMFESMLAMFTWAGEDYQTGHPEIAALFGGRQAVPFSDILEQTPELVRRARAGMGDEAAGVAPTPEAEAIGALLMSAFGQVERAPRVGLLPPVAGAESEAWVSLRDLAGWAMIHGTVEPRHVEVVRALEGMARNSGEPAKFAEHAEAWRAAVAALAKPQGDYERVEWEVHYYAFDPLGKSLALYILGFLLVACTWMFPRSRALWFVGLGVIGAALLLHAYGITLRCMIRGRPPISTLYETVVFITASMVLVLLVVEALTRLRVGFALAPVAGALGLFVAGRYEVLQGTDTMPQLVAVLDTNFWLATHVTVISIGYMAGLAAAMIAHVYLGARLLGPARVSPNFLRAVAGLVYGVLCFALITSLIGTILGGIWANDSWGRFWGWDPKENGALLIVLSQLAILHARMAGLIKAFGLCMSAIAAGGIVAFSWWGVNLLGIGLHSYGFTSGIFNGLLTFYCVEAAVLLVGAYIWLRGRAA
ncbi:MAG: cytochrome c biogenesis protein CcsA [Planctomycetota bacterium]|nr:cytochrome c biogenesis protein CcsA [Planctomycetota bacterium]